MKILIVHNHNRFTGVSTLLYTLSKELVSLGHDVYFWIRSNEDDRCILNEQLKFNGVKVIVAKEIKEEFDLILFNYRDTYEKYKHLKGVKKFFVHGLMDKAYVPPINGLEEIFVFGERAYDFINVNYKKTLIRNFIDVEYYKTKTTINKKLKNILVFDSRQNAHSQSLITYAASKIEAYVSILGESYYGNTLTFDVRTRIDSADLVIAYGRSAIEAMSMSKPVIIYGYNGGDGYIAPKNFRKMLETNLSGWSSGDAGINCSATKKLKPPFEEKIENLISEFEKYDSADGAINRILAQNYFSVKLYIDTITK